MNNTSLNRKRKSRNRLSQRASTNTNNRDESPNYNKNKLSADKFVKAAGKYFPDDFFYFAYRF